MAMSSAQVAAFNGASSSSVSSISLLCAALFAAAGLAFVAWLAMRGYEAWVKKELTMGELSSLVMTALLVVVFGMFLFR